MRTVQLSKSMMIGTVATYWNSLEFPDYIYIALETNMGFGESSGGVGCGDVVNALQDLEGGGFFEMARIDELILNLPTRDTLVSEGSWSGYPWEFATKAGDIGIEWV